LHAGEVGIRWRTDADEGESGEEEDGVDFWLSYHNMSAAASARLLVELLLLLLLLLRVSDSVLG
jgi:hypothetical protein